MIAFDLDGTLLVGRTANVPDRSVFGDEVRLLREVRACPAACAVVRLVDARGWERGAYVTGRPERLRRVTEVQLRRAHLPRWPLFMQVDYRPGMGELVAYKAGVLRALRSLGCYLYVGDELTDRDAARDAGVGFLDADEWRKFDPRGVGP